MKKSVQSRILLTKLREEYSFLLLSPADLKFFSAVEHLSHRGRIFHLHTDVIKTCFQVLRVILRLLIKHCKLHPQLFILYRPHLLQGESGKDKETLREKQDEWDTRLLSVNSWESFHGTEIASVVSQNNETCVENAGLSNMYWSHFETKIKSVCLCLPSAVLWVPVWGVLSEYGSWSPTLLLGWLGHWLAACSRPV